MRSKEIEEQGSIKWIPRTEMERRSREAAAKADRLKVKIAINERLKEIEHQSRDKAVKTLGPH